MGVDYSKINSTYNSTPQEHILQCEKVFNKATSFHDLTYSALEFRISVECLCLQYLWFFTYTKRKLTKTELKRSWVPDKTFKNVLKVEPNIQKHYDVINAILKSNNKRERLKYPDLDWLFTTYGQINDYLHVQKRLLQDEKKFLLYNLLKNAIPKFKDYTVMIARFESTQEHTKDIIEDYIKNKITKSQMELRIHISNIPIHMLNNPHQ